MTGSAAFGAPLVAVATGLVATGNTQGTALLLAAQTNVVVSAPAGTGVWLPVITSGTIIVQNLDPTKNLLVYPPSEAKINLLGYNAPEVIGPGGVSVAFATNNASDQWYSGLAPAPTAAQIVSALQLLPVQSQGYPPGGFWVNANGEIALAPVASQAINTNPNLLMVLRARRRNSRSLR